LKIYYPRAHQRNAAGEFTLKRIIAALAATIAMSSGIAAEPLKCPKPDADGHLIFPDGSILMKTGLQVNPDGAVASYTPGDHGYTYITNGVNLIENGQKVACAKKANKKHCRDEWIAAEAAGFAKGTSEFCVFAMEVEPLDAHSKTVTCEGDDSRFVAGNGKGRPKTGANFTDVFGAAKPTYLSTTTLHHIQNGKTVYVDSAAIPGLVATTQDLVGAIAWVRYDGREAFAIVNDTGGSFGEGTVALHQWLQSGSVGPTQSIGPIPLEQRCIPAETKLAAPFTSMPDAGPDDKCAPNYKPTSATDIRAYAGIDDEKVFSIILSKVKPPMTGLTVNEELTPNLLTKLATDAGYSAAKLHQMAACLK
jgi:hypothetical protein